MANGPAEDEKLPVVRGIGALWKGIRANWKTLLIMIAIWAVLAFIARKVADDNWRDDVPRTTIAAVMFALWVLTALALFGSQGSKTLLAVVAAAGAIAAVGGGAFKLDRALPPGPPDDGDLVDCPPDLPEGAANGFVASTELGYAHVRAEPSLSARVLLRYPPGCELEIVHYCVGEPKIHWRFDIPDPIWFFAEGDFHDGYIASADVRAGPGPRRIRLESCPGDEEPPIRPEITSPLHRRLSGPIEIAAAAPRASEVGFAAYYRDDPEDPQTAGWHQIAIDVATHDGVTAGWDTRSVPGQSTREPTAISLTVVPCLGLGFPLLEERETRNYVVANRAGGTPAPLDRPTAWREKAGRVACDNLQR